MTTNTKEHPLADNIEFFLDYLSNEEPGLIDDNSHEFYGEDENGNEGSCTLEITEIAAAALSKIKNLQQKNQEINLKLDNLFSLIQENQNELPPEFAKILNDNSWDLYIKN